LKDQIFVLSDQLDKIKVQNEDLRRAEEKANQVADMRERQFKKVQIKLEESKM
jgi:hypothetical protein